MSEPERVDGRTLRYKGRREELLAAATAYVLENGVSDLSMRPLAKAIGVSHTALSHQFGSKEQLIAEILESLRRYSMRARSSGPLTDGPFDGLEAYDVWWHQWSQDQFLPAIRLTFEVFGLAIQQPERYEAFLSHVFADWNEIYDAFLAGAGCPADQVVTIRTMLLAHMTGLQADLLATGERERINAAQAHFLALMERERASWIAAG